MKEKSKEVKSKIYFTIVNKEMYDDLMYRLHTYTDIVWTITNDLIKQPFHTMFNKSRELLFLDIDDGTLAYGGLKDFGLYYENPKYELLTNERFIILSKELFPNSKSNFNQIICEEVDKSDFCMIVNENGKKRKIKINKEKYEQFLKLILKRKKLYDRLI